MTDPRTDDRPRVVGVQWLPTTEDHQDRRHERWEQDATVLLKATMARAESDLVEAFLTSGIVLNPHEITIVRAGMSAGALACRDTLAEAGWLAEEPGVDLTDTMIPEHAAQAPDPTA